VPDGEYSPVSALIEGLGIRPNRVMPSATKRISESVSANRSRRGQLPAAWHWLTDRRQADRLVCVTANVFFGILASNIVRSTDEWMKICQFGVSDKI
jgi:hypothetical protein